MSVRSSGDNAHAAAVPTEATAAARQSYVGVKLGWQAIWVSVGGNDSHGAQQSIYQVAHSYEGVGAS